MQSKKLYLFLQLFDVNVFRFNSFSCCVVKEMKNINFAANKHIIFKIDTTLYFIFSRKISIIVPRQILTYSFTCSSCQRFTATEAIFFNCCVFSNISGVSIKKRNRLNVFG